ncbi:MAG TPA: hypothetical protein IGS17_20720 [Oscillatoriales cyanobacterium M59_W2019_021]|nr:hypothetical protein [Oscillatoriales cyanobacterium M4454_W2019_049]HIK53316.1 hypothetical protein [Oscillatoriales cyanobacterium M59_W2019_021]
MNPDFREIIPLPPQAVDEAFAVHQTSQEFYREVQYREELEGYAQWYYATAAAHRQEWVKMRGELNIFGWFVRKRR